MMMPLTSIRVVEFEGLSLGPLSYAGRYGHGGWSMGRFRWFIPQSRPWQGVAPWGRCTPGSRRQEPVGRLLGFVLAPDRILTLNKQIDSVSGAVGQIRFTNELASPSKRSYRSPGVAFGPAIAIALIYAGRASTRLTYETTFGRSSIVRPPNRGNEVSGNITITSAQVKSGPAK